MKKATIILPSYNEEKRIGRTLDEYSAFFEDLRKKDNLDYTLLIVINGTNDKTEEVVKKYSRKNPRIKYLNYKQKGKGFAITQGLKEALKSDAELIGFVDTDMATRPDSYYDLIENIGRHDGIIANRYLNKSKIVPAFNFRRIVISRIFNFLVRCFFRLPFSDTQCGAKLFKRKTIELIVNDFTITQWAYDIDVLFLCKQKKLKVSEWPTVWYETEGSSINIIRDSIGMFFAITQLRILRSPFRKALIVLKPVIGAIYTILRR